MPITFPPKIEPLSADHDRNGFDCGDDILNGYLQRQAMQDMRRNVSRVFVARQARSRRVVGYYTLSAASFRRQDLPEAEARRLPYYPIPAALLGRLAVDRDHQGLGLGKFLLFDAFHRVLQASEVLAVHALIVDAKHDQARDFYRQYGFLSFPDTPSRLFIPVDTLRQGAQES